VCVAGGGCCSCFGVILWLLVSLKTVPTGHLGVVTRFGSPSPELREPGLNLCPPFSGMNSLSVKTTLFEQSSAVPTQEGLIVQLTVALLFRLDPDKVYEIYTTLGTNFVERLIAPLLASEIRGLTSQNEAKALYTTREMLQSNLTAAMETALRPRGIVLEKALLNNIVLPDLLKRSIEAKAQAEQESERMKFVLAKEQQEADRKTIEARGIADFQRIVTEGITPSLLQWKGIEATEKFTQSSNSKLVIMGNSKASLPVMFSGDVAA